MCQAVVLHVKVNSNYIVDKITPLCVKLQAKADDFAVHMHMYSPVYNQCIFPSCPLS